MNRRSLLKSLVSGAASLPFLQWANPAKGKIYLPDEMFHNGKTYKIIKFAAERVVSNAEDLFVGCPVKYRSEEVHYLGTLSFKTQSTIAWLPEDHAIVKFSGSKLKSTCVYGLVEIFREKWISRSFWPNIVQHPVIEEWEIRLRSLEESIKKEVDDSQYCWHSLQESIRR